MVAGLVAPAWPAEITWMGNPRKTAFSMVWQASSAKRIGGTTWQIMTVRNGRSSKRSQLPASSAQMSAITSTFSGAEALTQTCFEVPDRQA